jgi:SAM-dependent methyltransferase
MNPPVASPPDVVVWRDSTGTHAARWLSPGSPPPGRVSVVDDTARAAAVLARLRRGEALLYSGDYHNARQLLAAVGRRLDARPTPRGDVGALFRSERERLRIAHDVLGRLLVPLEAGGTVPLRRAPDVSAAVAEGLGTPPAGPGLLPLRDLLGMIGALEWRRRGVPVPALGGDTVHPWFGVYAPIRGEYVDLVARAAAAWPPAGKRALDVGTGTGVLAILLARAGARVLATDLSPAAVGCARENVARLAPPDAVEVVEADLFPPGPSADLVVSNPPWIPADAHGPLDRAVYDPRGAFLSRLVEGLPARLAPGGEAWIVLSDLAERLGLRRPGHLAAAAGAVGLRVDGVLETAPAHPRSRDRADPLHAARAAEVVSLTRLVRG